MLSDYEEPVFINTLVQMPAGIPDIAEIPDILKAFKERSRPL